MKHKYNEGYIGKMLDFLVDNIFVDFGGRVFNRPLAFQKAQICLFSLDYALLISLVGILHWTYQYIVCLVSFENVCCGGESF